MKQQTFIQSILIALVVLLGVTACKKDPVEDPVSGLPPQQKLPNPLPAKALVAQLKWADTDHQTFTYNAKGQVSQLRSQWQFVEGDPTQIRTIVYDFEYDAQDRPVTVKTTDGFSARYIYHGNLIAKSQELYPSGKVSNEVTYIYANNRIAEEIWRVSNLPGEPVDVYKHAFSYDAKGNLNKIETYHLEENLQYRLLETIEYSDFDNKINPTSWMMRYPYLPQVQWQFNNPGKEVRKTGTEPARTTTFGYTYNTEQLPVTKRLTDPTGAVLNVEYRY